jgi:squalene-hopene/tetraprenyl-beta-curcumene cyclase
MLEYLRNSQ